uniref:Gustatory receptor n=1 Tax=Tetranychus urticae TaxID=32264 RepID=T1KQ68_TETUR
MYSIHELKMKLFGQWRNYSLSSLKTESTNLVLGLPNHGLTSEETIKQLVKFEKFLIFFRASRFGFNQNVSHPPTKTDYLSLIMRAIGQINLIRLICLTIIDNEDYQMYLGDTAYKTKHRITINVFFIICFLIGVVVHEWVALYDKSGKNSVLTIYSDIINNGFDPVTLQMTPNQAVKFHRTIHTLITQLNRNFLFCCLFLAICYYFMLLSNPHFYQVKEFVFYSLIWSLVAMITTFTLSGKYISIFGHLILMQVYHLFRLQSVVELADSYRRLKYNDEDASNFINSTFECLNQSEKCAKLTGTLVLCVFTAIAFICDLFIFYGFIMRFHSPVFANSLGSIAALFSSLLIERLYTHIHKIYRNNVLTVCNQFKLLQLMERLSDPNIGIQLGLITTIGKYFFIKFMMEIGSSLMLFTLNFKRYF